MIGALIMMAAYSLFFCILYRDRSFALFAVLSFIPVINLVIRRSDAIVEVDFGDRLRWCLVGIGWGIGVPYAVSILRLGTHLNIATSKFHKPLCFFAIFSGLLALVINKSYAIDLVIFSVALIFLIMNVTMYFAYPYVRKIIYLLFYVNVSIFLATLLDYWSGHFLGNAYEAWVYLFFLLSGMFVLSLTKVMHSAMLEQERSDFRIYVEQRQKMAALGEVSATIAHEIRNPLAALLYAADLQHVVLKKEPVEKPEIERLTRTIETTGRQIEKITSSLTQLARYPTKDPLEVINIKKMVDDTCQIFHMRLRQTDIQLQVGKIPEDTVVECRETQICQVLLNLLNNAFDAVQDQDEAWIRLDVINHSDRFSFAITDSGTGISPTIRDKINMPFFTTKEKGKGTGLGLKISKNIIEQHRGTLHLNVDYPNTRFEFTLPKRSSDT